jgi:hypothetical protein
MWPTGQYLARRGFAVRTFGYPSRRGTLVEHGRALQRFIDDWLGPRPPVLGFLTHSMGALVVRAYLRDAGPARLGGEQRIVMLSPPNRGSCLARRNRHNRIFHWVYGQAADELCGGAAEALGPLPSTARALILAGGTGGLGYNRLIEGDDDGLVAVAEMGMDGVEPTFAGGVHSVLQWTPRLLRRAVTFLETSHETGAAG